MLNINASLRLANQNKNWFDANIVAPIAKARKEFKRNEEKQMRGRSFSQGNT